MIKSVIFDMDGVLIDAREWHYLALNRALKLFGFEISRHQHLTTFDGLPTKKKLALLTMEEDLPESLHSYIAELKQKYTVELVHSNCNPSFKHLRLLTKLRNDGYITALASNSIKSTIELMLEKANLADKFEYITSAEDVLKPKPDPEIYIRTMEALRVLPTDCLVIEDNEHGVRAALASGAHVLQVVNPFDVSVENVYRRISLINSEKRKI
jgi:beta-phosphoglucomutase